MHSENDDPKWWTLDSLMKLNGSCFSSPSPNPRLRRLISTLRCVCVSDHTFIHILKIDIEGGEFDALTAFVNSHTQGDLPIGQLQIEIHAREGHERFDRFARWWASLEGAGLRPFWTEPNMVYVNVVHGARPELAEVMFLVGTREDVLDALTGCWMFSLHSIRLSTFDATTRSSVMLSIKATLRYLIGLDHMIDL